MAFRNFIIVLGAIILWAFNPYPSDATIIAREAQKYNVSKSTFNAPDDVINQLLRSTLAQSADVLFILKLLDYQKSLL